MHRHADDQRSHPVLQARCELPVRQIVTFLAPSADDIVAFIDCRDQPGNFFRRILQVRVERNDNLTARLSEARKNRRVLSEITRQLDDSDAPFLARRNFTQNAE
jgi:hypothetical protein